ncbi:MAG: cyclic dehypoxanthinyl futalosine synthase [Planctomycetota bacterium]|jgi:cyclic dehypoxanthinyl futalosine synthase
MSDLQLLESVANGEARLSVDDAVRIFKEVDLSDLAQAADTMRRRINGDSFVTYLVDRNINYTNVCITDCKFCEFYRPPGHKESYVISTELLYQKVQETIDLGGTRILLQGGHHPELRIDYYTDMLRGLKAKFPQVELNAFSPPEIAHVAELEGMTFREVLAKLKEAGMDGLPGGGGEILDDEIRKKVSPKKLMSKDWLSCMSDAHSLGMLTSASQVIGFGEEPRHRVNALAGIRETQDHSMAQYGLGFLSFVMWPLQFESRFGAVFGGLKGIKLGAEREEYLRHTALSRLFLDNVPHVGASWPTMGPIVAAEALSYGADDFGSTMIEENVVSSAGSTNDCMTEEEIRTHIGSAGYTPQKRDSSYQAI